MGAFNELILASQNGRIIQFKHGLCWQVEYKLGDTIDWDKLIRPEQADGRLEIPRISDHPSGTGWEYFAITIENDVIISAHRIDEKEFNRLDSLSP